jgi:hypothetical protein
MPVLPMFLVCTLLVAVVIDRQPAADCANGLSLGGATLAAPVTICLEP